MSSQTSEAQGRDMEAEKLPYFHFQLHRIDVDQLLQRNGDFMLRRGRYDGSEKYLISIRWDDGIKDIPCQKDGSGNWSFESHAFPNIRQLIEWHIETGTPVTDGTGARLERQVNRQPWELLSTDIEKKGILGKGNFGSVFEAIWKGRLVAVKTLDRMTNESEERTEIARIELLEEAQSMRAVSGHDNVVDAVGVTIDLEFPVLAMEIVKGKSLDKLRDRLEETSMGVKLRLVGEAAAGLAHIHGKGYLHRHMAARNCVVELFPDVGRLMLVGRLKLIDFGTASYVGNDCVYKLQKIDQMPIRWSALESLENKTWTTKSDVWGLGVLAWEIFTNGAQPFNDIMDLPLVDAVAMLKSGKRLKIPPDVPKDVAEMMQKSWDADPSNRPTAAEFRDVCFRPIVK